MKDHERIIRDRRIQSGHPVIAGTRVPVYVVVGALAAGDTIDEVCQGYGLTEPDVRAALAFAADKVATRRNRMFPLFKDRR